MLTASLKGGHEHLDCSYCTALLKCLWHSGNSFSNFVDLTNLRSAFPSECAQLATRVISTGSFENLEFLSPFPAYEVIESPEIVANWAPTSYELGKGRVLWHLSWAPCGFGSIQGADVTWEMFFKKELDNSEIPEQYRNVERFLILS